MKLSVLLWRIQLCPNVLMLYCPWNCGFHMFVLGVLKEGIPAWTGSVLSENLRCFWVCPKSSCIRNHSRLGIIFGEGSWECLPSPRSIPAQSRITRKSGWLEDATLRHPFTQGRTAPRRGPKMPTSRIGQGQAEEHPGSFGRVKRWGPWKRWACWATGPLVWQPLWDRHHQERLRKERRTR